MVNGFGSSKRPRALDLAWAERATEPVTATAAGGRGGIRGAWHASRPRPAVIVAAAAGGVATSSHRAVLASCTYARLALSYEVAAAGTRVSAGARLLLAVAWAALLAWDIG